MVLWISRPAKATFGWLRTIEAPFRGKKGRDGGRAREFNYNKLLAMIGECNDR